jgi:uncharacterized protein GlcG (DUF336 family)
MVVAVPGSARAQALTPSAPGSAESLPAAILNPPSVSPLAVSLGLDRASAIIDEALRLGREHQMLPLTVVILDHGGHMVALKREDGSGIIRVQVANAKAYGALGMGVSSRLMGQRLADRPVFSGSLSVVSDGQYVPVPGGVLIRDAGGSVGISGDTSDRDEFAAINAVKSIGLYPEPLEPSPEWDGSHL